jgi:hypothetical protein
MFWEDSILEPEIQKAIHHDLLVEMNLPKHFSEILSPAMSRVKAHIGRSGRDFKPSFVGVFGIPACGKTTFMASFSRFDRSEIHDLSIDNMIYMLRVMQQDHAGFIPMLDCADIQNLSDVNFKDAFYISTKRMIELLKPHPSIQFILAKYGVTSVLQQRAALNLCGRMMVKTALILCAVQGLPIIYETAFSYDQGSILPEIKNLLAKQYDCHIVGLSEDQDFCALRLMDAYKTQSSQTLDLFRESLAHRSILFRKNVQSLQHDDTHIPIYYFVGTDYPIKGYALLACAEQSQTQFSPLENSHALFRVHYAVNEDKDAGSYSNRSKGLINEPSYPKMG